MKVLSIDPGNVKSAYAVYRDGAFIEHDIVENPVMLHIIKQCEADYVVIERVECMGMAVGKSVFETCIWIGRFIQEALKETSAVVYTLGRRHVKMHLCGSMKAKDSNIRQAVMDRFGSTREKAIGTKKAPGPLYGASKDVWSAMAIAITASESREGLVRHE
jgi:hypothetical protein